MNEKEYKKSLEKLLGTLFKRAENPFIDGRKVFDEFQLVNTIKLVHDELKPTYVWKDGHVTKH